MPLPFIIGAAALAATSYGAKKGYDGYKKQSEAKDTIEAAKWAYEDARSRHEEQKEKTERVIEKYGKFKIKIGNNFEKFQVLAAELLEKINQDRKEKLKIDIPKYQLQKIAGYTMSAVSAMGTVAGAGVAGAAAGFAVYGGVMTLGAASTGTAISTLSGAAATKATLAAIGGGSLATGGMGIAGGTALLGASVAAPVLAIAGFAYDKYGDKAKENADKVFYQNLEVVKKINRSIDSLSECEDYVGFLKNSVAGIYGIFCLYFEELKRINSIIVDGGDVRNLGADIVKVIENGYAVAAILTNIVTTPLFKVKEENGRIVKKENGEPEMLTDEDGAWILNDEVLDSVQKKGFEDVKNYIPS